MFQRIFRHPCVHGREERSGV